MATLDDLSLSVSGVVKNDLSPQFAETSPFPDAPLVPCNEPKELDSRVQGLMHRSVLGLDRLLDVPEHTSRPSKTMMMPSRFEVQSETDVGVSKFTFKHSVIQLHRLLREFRAAGQATDHLLIATVMAACPMLIFKMLKACKRLEEAASKETVTVSLTTLPERQLNTLLGCVHLALNSIWDGHLHDVDSGTVELLSSFVHNPDEFTVISRLLPFMKELYKGLLRPKHMVDGAQFDTSVPIRAERLYGLVQQAVMARPAPVTVTGLLEYFEWLEPSCSEEARPVVPIPKLLFRNVSCEACCNEDWIGGAVVQLDTATGVKYFCPQHLEVAVAHRGKISFGLPSSVKSAAHMLAASTKAREREQPVEEPVQENTEVLDMIIHRHQHVNLPPVNLYERTEPVNPQTLPPVNIYERADPVNPQRCDDSDPPLTTESRGSTSVTTVRRVLKQPAKSDNSFMNAHWSAHEKALTRPVLGTTQGNTGKVQHVSGQTRVQSWLTTETHGSELRLKAAGLVAAGAGLPQPLVHVLTEEAGETLDEKVLNSLDVRHAAFSGSRLSHQASLPEEASSPSHQGASPDARRRLAEKKRSMVGRVLAVSNVKRA